LKSFLAEPSSSRAARWMSSTPASIRALASMLLGWVYSLHNCVFTVHNVPAVLDHQQFLHSDCLCHLVSGAEGGEAQQCCGPSTASAMLLSPGVFALAASLIRSSTNPERSGSRVAGPIIFAILQIYLYRPSTKEKLHEKFSQKSFTDWCLFNTQTSLKNCSLFYSLYSSCMSLSAPWPLLLSTNH
jgi:hypothetical protein